jgi:mono/diheme cytochrome c family protein
MIDSPDQKKCNRGGAESAENARRNKRIFLLRVCLRVLCAFAVASSLSCEQRVKSDSAKTKATVDKSSVKTISVPHYQAQLPPGPGREAFAEACVMCHSVRYIEMQPPLTSAKWEESVRKMMKVYAAPVTEEQIPQIVQYLLATKEAGITSGWDSAVVATGGQPIEVKSLEKADVARGEKLFAQNCASCHGADGRSNTAGAKEQLPHATDLTTARFSVERLASVIHNGVPGTAMPGYPQLSAEDVASLAKYAQKFNAPVAKVESPVAEVKTLYAQNCLSCHGATGEGDGPQAPLQPRSPANFKLKQPTPEQAIKAINDGIPGSTMPQWKTKLNKTQIEQLANYARSLYAGS